MKKYSIILLSTALLIATGSSTLQAKFFFRTQRDEQQEPSDEQNEQQEKADKDYEQTEEWEGIKAVWEGTKSAFNTTWTIATTVSGTITALSLGNAVIYNSSSGVIPHFRRERVGPVAGFFFICLLSIKYLYKTQRALDRVLDNLGRENEAQTASA